MNLYKIYRKKAHLTVKEASEKLNVGFGYMQKIESGHSTPSRDLILKMCKVYGCEPNDLLKVK